MMQSVCRLVAVFAICMSMLSANAQPLKKDPKPYKVLTSGKQLTIKSSKNIQSLMVWTLDGHRVVEQRDINNSEVRVDIPVQRAGFYLMIGMSGGKVYTERIGIQ